MGDDVRADGILRANRELYEAGEYFALSQALLPAAEALVAAAGVKAGQRVLDVGAGDGSVSMLAIDRGAQVTACDLSVVQLERAIARCDGRLPGAVAGDAGRLPFADGAFDVVLSSFGAVIAPDPDRTAAELVRVCRPGGVIGLTAWPPDSLVAELTAAVRDRLPDPATFPDQELGWGVPATARRHLGAHAEDVRTERRRFVWDTAARTAAGADDCAARYLAAHAPGVDLGSERAAIAARHHGPDGLVADFLLVLARRPGQRSTA